MEINGYGRQLTDAEIESQLHRDLVGGLWDELGLLQFEFLKRRGLKPHHKIVDVGCGALRGGVHFVRYLEPGCYHGIDANASLIQAGRQELEQAGLDSKTPKLRTNDQFDIGGFSTKFDYALALSLFTHLPMNHIVRCLAEVRRSLSPEGCFFATFFEAPHSAYLQQQLHAQGAIVTHYDRDPYHQSIEEMQWLAKMVGMRLIGSEEWGHPRGQKMLTFISRRAWPQNVLRVLKKQRFGQLLGQTF